MNTQKDIIEIRNRLGIILDFESKNKRAKLEYIYQMIVFIISFFRHEMLKGIYLLFFYKKNVHVNNYG